MKKNSNSKYKITISVLILALILFTGISAGFSSSELNNEQIVENQKSLSVNWVPYNEGLLKAEQENKHILVQFVTDGCSWCDKMDSEVYTNPDVIKIIQDKFVAIKINGKSNNLVKENGEEMTERNLALLYQVSGYPTTWFLESKGEGIAPLPGYAPAEQFITVLNYIGDAHYKQMTWQEYVEQTEKPVG